jgi:hypothetical protein
LAAAAVVVGLVKYGRFGAKRLITQISFPSKGLTLIAAFVAATSLVGVMNVRVSYYTPEEMRTYLDRLRNEATEPYQYYSMDLTRGPLSGFFFYLDSNRVSKSYHAMLSELQVAGRRDKSSLDKSKAAGADIAGLKVDASIGLASETEVTMVPTAATPERQACEIIAVAQRGKAVYIDDVPPERTISKSPVQIYSDPLEGYGVALTTEQKAQFNSSWAEQMAKRYLDARDKYLICSGLVTFSCNSGEYLVTFMFTNNTPITCRGELAADSLDSVLSRALKGKTNTLTLPCKMLAVCVTSTRRTNDIEILAVPYAIW